MPKLTKTVKTDDIYPPREIRENTKARRAWLAERLAELHAAPQHAASKIVGQGSYQRISVYVSTEADGRLRQRGTCQACGGSQVVDQGVMVLHGYERPGTGWINGRCMGVMHAPAEHDVTMSVALVDACERKAAELAGHVAQHPMVEGVSVYGWPEFKLEYRYGREHEKERERVCAMARTSRANRDHAEHLRTNVLPRLGKPLTDEVVPA